MLSKTWKIIKHEYARHVFRWRFILGLLSLPAIFVFSLAAGFFVVSVQMDRSPVGYVDLAHFIQIKALPQNGLASIFQVSLVAFPSESAARAALDRKEIQAYFVLPADYPQTYSARLVYLRKPFTSPLPYFNSLLRANLLAGQSPQVVERVQSTPEMEIQASAEERETAINNMARMAAPFGMGMLIFLSIFSTSGYLAKALQEEKENRMTEILVTSVSAGQIMTGKIIGLISVGMTQVLVWCSLPMAFLVYLAVSTPFLRSLIDWQTGLLLVIMTVCTLGLFSILIATIGATLIEGSEAQQMTGMISMFMYIPFPLVNVITKDPGGLVAMILSYFPLTALETLLMRIASSTVPAWQILLSTLILVFTTAGAMWLAGRIFRASMLRYGKGLNLKEIVRAILPFSRKGSLP
jgi:ABC-2 type transport system permease protein